MRVSIIGENLGVADDEIEIGSIDELAAVISSESWAPASFTEHRRNIKSMACIELLVLDVDQGCTLEEAQEKFKLFKHIIATSRSHQKEKNGVVCDRFRVVLFLSEPILNDEDFKATWTRASKLFPFIDPACKDSARFFYPSPGITSINRSGRVFDISIATKTAPVVAEPIPDGAPKGELWKDTLKFLLEGAPAGSRHNALVKAVGNMKEQGYSRPETLAKLEEMAERGDWTQDHLSKVDIATVDRMYARENKYGYVPPQTENIGPALNANKIVSVAELADEAFEYLSDKERVKGEPTGIDGLDRLLGGGTRTGEMSVLMAQAKTGKNSLLHDLMFRRLTRGDSYAYASRELDPAREVVPNLLSIALGLNAWHADVSEAFKARARELLAQWPLYFAPGYGHFASHEIEAWFRECRDIGITHFLFDHFHYALEGEDYDATAKLIKHLKTLTKQLDIHLILIVQPRSLREGEQLSLATLRGGAAIGQALDNLLVLERVKGDQANISKLTLEVARHKLARLGHIYLQYDTTTTAFQEVDRTLVVEAPPMPKGLERKVSWPRADN